MTTPLTPAELAEARAIYEKMTPGEWSYEVVAGLKNRPALMIRNRPSLWKEAKYFMPPNDARGFANLHNIMPRLLAMAERVVVPPDVREAAETVDRYNRGECMELAEFSAAAAKLAEWLTRRVAN